MYTMVGFDLENNRFVVVEHKTLKIVIEGYDDFLESVKANEIYNVGIENGELVALSGNLSHYGNENKSVPVIVKVVITDDDTREYYIAESNGKVCRGSVKDIVEYYGKIDLANAYLMKNVYKDYVIYPMLIPFPTYQTKKPDYEIKKPKLSTDKGAFLRAKPVVYEAEYDLKLNKSSGTLMVKLRRDYSHADLDDLLRGFYEIQKCLHQIDMYETEKVNSKSNEREAQLKVKITRLTDRIQKLKAKGYISNVADVTYKVLEMLESAKVSYFKDDKWCNYTEYGTTCVKAGYGKNYDFGYVAIKFGTYERAWADGILVIYDIIKGEFVYCISGVSDQELGDFGSRGDKLSMYAKLRENGRRFDATIDLYLEEGKTVIESLIPEDLDY